jgi:hypothetical protein
MTFTEDDGASKLFDDHGEYEHVGISRVPMRIGVVVIGVLLITAVISGMFLY